MAKSCVLLSQCSVQRKFKNCPRFKVRSRSQLWDNFCEKELLPKMPLTKLYCKPTCKTTSGLCGIQQWPMIVTNLKVFKTLTTATYKQFWISEYNNDKNFTNETLGRCWPAVIRIGLSHLPLNSTSAIESPCSSIREMMSSVLRMSSPFWKKQIPIITLLDHVVIWFPVQSSPHGYFM